MTFTARWGILATGGIAKKFTSDLLVNASTRQVDDVAHQVAAIASSSGKDRAEQFAKDLGVTGATCYGNYDDLVADKNVDIIYVATPHSHHYQCCKLALEAGKNVLCEKPFTINAVQLEKLTKLAKEKNLFLMEAVWTRFFPLVQELQKKVFQDQVIGRVHRVTADLSIPFDVDIKHRIKNPDLGGGSLLDLGVYPLTWLFLFGYGDPANKRSDPQVTSSMLMSKDTHVDEFTTIIANFPQSHVSTVATCSYSAKSNYQEVCRIEGDKGFVSVAWPTFCPTDYSITKYVDGFDGEKFSTEKFHHDIPGSGHGMFWEADECARCLRDGKKESSVIPLSESMAVAKVMDQARAQNNFTYPAELESS